MLALSGSPDAEAMGDLAHALQQADKELCGVAMPMRAAIMVMTLHCCHQCLLVWLVLVECLNAAPSLALTRRCFPGACACAMCWTGS